MIRNLPITTAAIALMTSASVAAETDTNAKEQNTQPEARVTYSPSQEHILATNLVGTSVFAGQ